MASRMTRKQPSHITRGAKARSSTMEDAFCVSKASSIGTDKEKSIATTMAPATMTQPSATLLNLARSTFS
eukprot:4264391-Ditylum_brightwellii.AAC.1